MNHQTRAQSVELQELNEADLQQKLITLGLHLKPTDCEQLLRRLGRAPTRAELTIMDSMWSEHCSYKSTRPLLRTLPTQAANVVLGPGSDAGIVRLPTLDPQGNWCSESTNPAAPCIAVAHESHNHPSQLLPYEGAATGVGGIVRDVYCMGAEVIAVLDALRFGDPEGDQAATVRQVARGVVDGIAGYGNALGVPNLGGEVVFDSAFDDNCLVNVIALGILNEDEIVPSRAPDCAGTEGYALMLVGKPTDDSGLGGAAFASGLLDTQEDTQERGAVQLPDPFFKRVLTEANRRAIEFLRGEGLPFAMKDLGAAGLAGASSEMAGELGLHIDLAAVHSDRDDRPAAVLLVAETQERYVFAVPQHLTKRVQEIYEQDFELSSMVLGAGARVIGRFSTDGLFQAKLLQELHVDVPTSLITGPLEIEWPRAAPEERVVNAQVRDELQSRDFTKDLECMLRGVNGASRYGVFAHFDSDVQGRTLFRPGDSDAGVVVPDRATGIGVAIGVGSAPRLQSCDGWRAGAQAVVEATRNVVATGATPWTLTDCLNYGNPEVPSGMREIAEGTAGLASAARALGLRGSPGDPLPFVSGNVSLYNASHLGRSIPPTPIVACFGVLMDASTACPKSILHVEDRLIRVGATSAALGGSYYAEATRQESLLNMDDLPELDLEFEKRLQQTLLEMHDARLLHACHDVNKGGDLFALLEMLLGRRGEISCGIELEVEDENPRVEQWFSEAAAFWCAVAPANASAVREICERNGVPCDVRGRVIETSECRLHLRGDKTTVWPLSRLATMWQGGLNPVLREGTNL